MKLLYLSCHSVLEYDELRLFEDLEIDYFSLGSYINPRVPVDPIRPALSHEPDTWLATHAPDRNAMPQEFLDKFDVIVVMHIPEWIINNWSRIKGKRVIWRTIGQSVAAVEKKLAPYRRDGLEVVRYSKREANIPGTIGCDRIIPFYKDPNEFNGWMGAGTEVITFAQNMKHRGEFCNYDAYVYLTAGFNAHIYGPKNEESGNLAGGYLTYQEQRQKLRDARAYIYTGTQPASYTLNFIEALMTGVPVIAVGSKYGNSLKYGDLYEIPDIIRNDYNGYISDNLDELREKLSRLVTDVRLARRIGECGRDTALELFGMERIKKLWKEYLGL